MAASTKLRELYNGKSISVCIFTNQAEMFWVSLNPKIQWKIYVTLVCPRTWSFFESSWLKNNYFQHALNCYWPSAEREQPGATWTWGASWAKPRPTEHGCDRHGCVLHGCVKRGCGQRGCARRGYVLHGCTVRRQTALKHEQEHLLIASVVTISNNPELPSLPPPPSEPPPSNGQESQEQISSSQTI